MNPMPIILGVLLSVIGVEIQARSRDMILYTARVRRSVAGSGSRCPEVQTIGHCQVTVSARHGSQWQPCDQEHPPTGANLPMHRWFRVTGRCELTHSWPRITLPLPPQLVYR